MHFIKPTAAEARRETAVCRAAVESTRRGVVSGDNVRSFKRERRGSIGRNITWRAQKRGTHNSSSGGKQAVGVWWRAAENMCAAAPPPSRGHSSARGERRGDVERMVLRGEPPAVMGRERIMVPERRLGRMSTEMSWMISLVPLLVLPLKRRPGRLSDSPLMRPSPVRKRSA